METGQYNALTSKNTHSINEDDIEMIEDALGILINKLAFHSYKKKQSIYYEGNPALGIYCVKSGRVKTYKIGPEGKLYILYVAQAGDFLGVEAMFSGDRFVSSGEMLEDGLVGFMDRHTFLHLMQQNSSVAHKVIEILAKNLKTSEEERIDVAQRSVRERMARLLIQLSLRYGIPEERGVLINLKLSREDLAEMIGTAVQTAMRLLKEFKEEKLISLRSKEIIVLDKKGLIRASSLVDGS